MSAHAPTMRQYNGKMKKEERSGFVAGYGMLFADYRDNKWALMAMPISLANRLLTARRSSAEHLIATKALRCTATARMLIVAESFAKL